jgi:hypothetical protein
MKWLPTALCISLLLMAVPALAQNPRAAEIQFGSTISSVGEVQPTPEMWFYERYVNQYQDPKLAVRQKAEDRAAQRRGRIAARRWFGFSNIRPTAGTDFVHGDPAPGWSGRNANYPFRWSGYGAAAVVVRPVTSRGVY